MSATMNGLELASRQDTTASRCLDILERGMRRLGMDTSMPAEFNKIMPAESSAQKGNRQAFDRRKRQVDEFLAEYVATPAQSRSLTKIAHAHRLGIAPARLALVEAGLLEAPTSLKALRAPEAKE